MRRSVRALIGLLCMLGTSVLSDQPSWAQSASKVPRVGFFSPRDANAALVTGFQTGLKELGYSEGRNILVDYRWGQGRFETLPKLASELLDSQVDVIVAVVTAASLAAKAATDKVPIVMIGVGDPVGVGLVASLARPGGISLALRRSRPTWLESTSNSSKRSIQLSLGWASSGTQPMQPSRLSNSNKRTRRLEAPTGKFCSLKCPHRRS